MTVNLPGISNCDKMDSQTGRCGNTPRLLTTRPKQEVLMAGRITTSKTSQIQSGATPRLGIHSRGVRT